MNTDPTQGTPLQSPIAADPRNPTGASTGTHPAVVMQNPHTAPDNTENTHSSGYLSYDVSDRETERLREDFQALLEDAQKLWAQGSMLSVQALTELKTQLTQRIEAARAQLSGMSNKAVCCTHEYTKICEAQIRHRPMRAVGIALGIGVMLGILINGDRS